MATLTEPTATTFEIRPFYKNWKTLLGTTNHKEIGILYIVFAFANFLIAGLFALLIRMELAMVGPTLVDSSTYSVLFTLHGTIMIFLVIMPLGAGFGNFFVPLFIGADDMYWPRWNNAAFWLLIPGALFIYLGQANITWTAYPPMSLVEGNSVIFWTIGLLIVGVSSLAGAINFIMTIFFARKPGVRFFDLDLFTWSILITSFIQLIATPIITTGLILLLTEKLFNTGFFTKGSIGGPVLWQHVFWAYSHPAVYIMILPSMGITSYLISKFSRNEIFGYYSMVLSMAAIALIGMSVWGHHMFVVGVGVQINYFFTFLTFVIAVPSGIKMFNWVLTMYGGRIKFEAPFLFSLGFLVGFLFGGLTGVMLNVVPYDIMVHDTYWVVGHFHFIVIGGAVSALFGMLYYLFPRVTGKMYDRKLALWHFGFWFAGFIITFSAFSVLGALGMPRRYFDYPFDPSLQIWHQIATIGALLQAVAVIIWVVNIFKSIFQGEPVENPDDPFNLGTMEVTAEPA